MIYPPKLHSGDTIAIVSPAGLVESAMVTGAVQRLNEWGVNSRIYPHTLHRCGRFAGTIEQRLDDMHSALCDDAIKAILCARGGYGAIQLVEYIDPEWITKSPKWLIGYSDISLLHALWSSYGIASLHAPMASHLTQSPANDEASNYLRQILLGNTVTPYCLPSHPLNRFGTVHGELTGGNLSVIASLRSTPLEASLENKILFIEDIGESPYRIERMIYQLHLSGNLHHIAALIVGQFTNHNDELLYGQTIYERIAEIVAPYDFPCCYDFAVGHVTRNYPLVVGGTASLQITPQGVILQQLI